MIDWLGLAANSLWILGCALALASFSYASWQASLANSKLSAQLKRPQLQAGFNLAGGLVSAGLALASGQGWPAVGWAAMGVLFIMQSISNARSIRTSK